MSKLGRREPAAHGYTVVGRPYEKGAVIVNREAVATDTILRVHGLARRLLPDLDPRRPEHSRPAGRKLGGEKENEAQRLSRAHVSLTYVLDRRPLWCARTASRSLVTAFGTSHRLSERPSFDSQTRRRRLPQQYRRSEYGRARPESPRGSNPSRLWSWPLHPRRARASRGPGSARQVSELREPQRVPVRVLEPHHFGTFRRV